MRVLAVAALVGCQTGTDGDAVEPAALPYAPLQVAPGQELDGEVDPALHFRLRGSAFEAMFDTHNVRVTGGVARVTPIQPRDPNAVASPPMTFETKSILIDEMPYMQDVATSRINSAGALELDRGAVTEIWKNREDGARQEWLFATEPSFTGDLTVEVAVSGFDYVATNASGLHFRGPAGLGLRYGHAVWVDADGKTYDIAATYENGRVRMIVPDAVLEITAFPAVLDPTVGAEVAIDSPVSGLGLGGNGAAVAFDGTNYLVAWADLRDGAQTDIWATRVSATGQILDAFGILVASGTGIQTNPAVVFDGTQYVIAWEDFKVLNGTEADIDVATISTTGTVTSLAAVGTSLANDVAPALASNGSGALLTWRSGPATMSATFTGTFGAPFVVGASANAQKDPAVAAAPGGGYLITFTETQTGTGDDLRGQFVTAGGALGSLFTISAGAGPQDSSSVAFDGTNFNVVWRTQNPTIDVYGTRVTPAGAILDTHSEGTTTGIGGKIVSNATNNQERPTIACTPAGCLVAWQDRRNVVANGYDVYGQLLTTSFTPAAGEFLIANAPNYQVLPRATVAGSDYFVVWQDSRTGSPYPAGSRVTGAGSAVDANGIIINPAVNSEAGAAIARAGSTLAIVWSDTRGADGADIAASRFSTNNNKLDGTAVTVSSATNSQGSPAVAGTSSSFVVAWSDTRSGQNDVYAARLGTSGGVVDSAGIAVSTAVNTQLVPAVASDGTNALVVWQDRQSGAFDIYGAIVSGGTAGAPFVISGATGDQLRPAVAWNGAAGQYVVVWVDSRSGTRDIFGARVSAAGAVLDAAGVLISSGAADRSWPRVASSGGSLLAVWDDRRNNQAEIYGSRLQAGAQLTDLDAADLRLTSNSATQTTPAIATLGGSWLVLWADSRTSATTLTDIYGQQVALNGGLVGANFVVSATTDDESAPAAVDSTTNYVRVAYQKRVANLRANRIVTRVVFAEQASGTVCTVNSQCSSGFCVDGKCCSTACGNDSRTDCQACAQSKTGQPDGTCAPLPSITICRNYALVNGVQQTRCDLREYCDGTNVVCPADRGRNEGLSCDPATGGTGSGGTCPESDPPGPHVCQ